MAKKDKEDGIKMVSRNRKASHEYELTDRLECGIVLVGTEVKTLRDGHCSLDGSYAKIDGEELWLIDCEIPEYPMGNRFIGGNSPSLRARPPKKATHLFPPASISRMAGQKSRSPWVEASKCTINARR